MVLVKSNITNLFIHSYLTFILLVEVFKVISDVCGNVLLPYLQGFPSLGREVYTQRRLF